MNRTFAVSFCVFEAARFAATVVFRPQNRGVSANGAANVVSNRHQTRMTISYYASANDAAFGGEEGFIVRTDIRWPDDAPVTRLLAGIPRSRRADIIRSIVEAALVPGGWARLAGGEVHVALSTPVASPALAVPTGDEPVNSDPAGPAMSPAGRSSFLDGLRQFGAELGD